MPRICLVSCGKRKANRACRAADIYISPLFQGAMHFAEARFDSWFVLSAKHGLLPPEEVIEPYDMTLNGMSLEARRQWSTRVYNKLRHHLGPTDQVTFLAGETYREFLLPKLEEDGFSCAVPLEGRSLGEQLSWFLKLDKERQRLHHLDRFYTLLQKLTEGIGGTKRLEESSADWKLPPMGVYFFFESNEMRTTAPEIHRVVRVGTHTVSRGSKATLWNRLRAHRGAMDLSGNHRGSIFRLHVGTAMLEKTGRRKTYPFWGLGQNAPADVRAQEAAHERQVSTFLREMPLLWLDVRDEAGPESDRAYIEQNAIGLLAGPTGPLDLPSRNWLGKFSDRPAIRESGLWNVNHVTQGYDPQFLDVLEQYVDITLGKSPLRQHSLAPVNWQRIAKLRDSSPQIELPFTSSNQ